MQARFALATMYDKRRQRADAAKPAKPAAPERTGPTRAPGTACRAGAAEMSARMHARRGAPLAAVMPGLAVAPAAHAAQIHADAAADHRRSDVQEGPVWCTKNTPAAADSAKAMENYRRFLELQRTDPKLRAEAMRRLGDLNLESGELERMAERGHAARPEQGRGDPLYTRC